MKTKTLAIVIVLICSFLAGPKMVRAEENEWYQGQQGEWERHGPRWRWRSTHGDQWYQGRQGHWYLDRKGWHWIGNDGDDYRQGPHGWQWSGERGHDAH